jgi:hypothetical protein
VGPTIGGIGKIENLEPINVKKMGEEYFIETYTFNAAQVLK